MTAVAHYSLANAYAARGALDEAAAAFEAALAAHAGYPPAHHGLGQVRLRQRRYAEALRCFEAVVDRGFAGLDYGMGVALQGLGDERGAARAFRAALVHEPDRLPALNNLCVALLRAGEPDQAMLAIERYLAHTPTSCKALAYKAAALQERGRVDEANALLDFDRLVVRSELSADTADAADNAALEALIHHHPSLRYEPTGKSTRGGRQTGELLDTAHPAAAALREAIVRAVRAYIAYVQHALPTHPYTARLPKQWRLATWGVVLDPRGHQLPHFHPDGAISGVYYVRAPRALAAPAGWLELGRTRDAFGGHAAQRLALIPPHAGTLVVFPSYVYHRTLPFEAAESRISIAFDVLPAG